MVTIRHSIFGLSKMYGFDKYYIKCFKYKYNTKLVYKLHLQV